MVGEDTHPTAMWCRQCQQDVPVLRGGVGAAACPRCRAALGQPTDAGLALESFDETSSFAPLRATTPARRWQLDDAALDLRRIGRRLRSGPSHPVEVIYHSAPEAELPQTAARPLMDAAAQATSRALLPAPNKRRPPVERRPSRMSGAALVADVGMVVMIAGAATLAAHSQGILQANVWPWGVGEAALGAALFCFGLFRLATLTSQQCRRLERQVDGLRAEFDELKGQALGASGLDPSHPLAMRFEEPTQSRSPRFEEPGAKRRGL